MTTESNPYESPQATISDVSDIEHVLASRWSRLGAAFLDMIFMLIIVLPFIIAG